MDAQSPSSAHTAACKTSAPCSARSELIAVALLLTLALGCLNANFLIVLLQRRKVLTRLRELTLLHALTNIVVHEGALRVHQVKLVVDAREDLRNGRGVAHHAHRTHHLRQVATRHHGWRLVVDATLEARGAPIHELHRALCLDRGD